MHTPMHTLMLRPADAPLQPALGEHGQAEGGRGRLRSAGSGAAA